MAEQDDKVKPAKVAYVIYYVVLFFAYWFGASRFDVDGDGDFDPEDVEAYLEDCMRPWGQAHIWVAGFSKFGAAVSQVELANGARSP